MDELKKLIEAMKASFEAFKAENESRLKQIEARGSADPLTVEKLSKIGVEIADLQAKVQAKTQQLAAIEKAVALSLAPGNAPSGKPQRVYNSIGEQLLDVRADALARGLPSEARSRLEKVVAVATGAGESVPADGGWLVQKDTAAPLDLGTQQTGILASRCTPIPISANSNGVRIPIMNETSRASGSRYGGIQVFWADEAATFTASRPRFRMFESNLKKLIGLMYATDELLADAVALTAMVNRWFPLEFGFKLDDGIVNGTGVGQMLGFLQSPALVSVTKETGQKAQTLLYENIAKMFARLIDSSDANAIWLYNRDALPQLLTMSLSVGTGGAPIFLPATGAADRPYNMLLGKPMISIEQAATLGTVGDINLVDLSEYALATKGNIVMASSIHVQFLTDEMAFRWTYRVDGQPFRNAPTVPFTGAGNTRSPFVALATRA
jgi:HK97 family phage major capsid protein